MIKTKIIAIAVAALVVAGAAAVMLWPSGDDNGKKGWYAWDPTVGEIDYSKISATPRIIDTIEEMYKIVYGELPEPSADPSMTFDPLAVTDKDGNVKIKSSGTGAGVPANAEVTFTKDEINKMKIISYGKGFTDSYIDMFGADVWNKVVAAGNSTWTAYPNNNMVCKSTLASEMSISTLNLLTFFESDAFDMDSTYCLVVWGYMTNYEAVMNAVAKYGNVKLLCIDYYDAIKSLPRLMAAIDALGQLVGISADDNVSLTDFQKRLSAVTAAAGSLSSQKTVYMELSAGTSPGANTLTQLCFDALSLKNINTTSGTNIFSGVSVVTEMPKVIFFDVKDTRTMDQKMRVIM
ncbi:MAG: hypothetical protein LBE48_03910 [Methanomassiliicoccaceae archaeon]|jgi:hypothetical protein|nr:hypothetical protein [Methanomassiliicoccaceae archaeon]